LNKKTSIGEEKNNKGGKRERSALMGSIVDVIRRKNYGASIKPRRVYREIIANTVTSFWILGHLGGEKKF